jgi:hypothetical protein
MTTMVWNPSSTFGDYELPDCWVGDVAPGASDTAEFEASSKTNISIDSVLAAPDAWYFGPGATQYNFSISSTAQLWFQGTGITENECLVRIFNFGITSFYSGTADGAIIDNFNLLEFLGPSSGGSAVIHTFGGGGRIYVGFGATGGDAQFVTDAGGTVYFADSSGPDGLGDVTAGSIAGAGTYKLDGAHLTVGLNGLLPK